MKVKFVLARDAIIEHELDYIPRVGERVLLTLNEEVRTFFVSMVISRIEDGEVWIYLTNK